jgi:hypothetical protein
MLMSLLRFDLFYISSQIRLGREQNLWRIQAKRMTVKISHLVGSVIDFAAELPFM